MDAHKKWLSKRKAKDKILQTTGCGIDFDGIDIPGPNDVLLGRGKPFRDHIGNQRLRSIVDQYREEYDQAKFGGKPAIAEKVIEHVHAQRGRFLKQSKDNWWMQVTHDEAMGKVGHTFRTARTGDASYAIEKQNRKRAKTEQPQKKSRGGCLDFVCEEEPMIPRSSMFDPF